MGIVEGKSVGTMLGDCVGVIEGDPEGSTVGGCVGVIEGNPVGTTVGGLVGTSVGKGVVLTQTVKALKTIVRDVESTNENTRASVGS